MNCEKAKQFISENARPLDLAMYRFFFQGASVEAVLEELRKFQNPDGGFGHGLEADNWNPNSNPIATNDAIIRLHSVDGFAQASDMVEGIVRYLKSHDSFDEDNRSWLFAIESNRDYPHAFWWEKTDSGISGYNPTVSLAAFMVCFGEDSPYYREIVRDGFSYLRKVDEIGGDSLKCFLLSYEMLEKRGIEDVIDLPRTKALLSRVIWDTICKDTGKYGVEYVPVPSDFFAGMYGEFVTPEIQKLIDVEKQMLGNLQKEDGGFDISWEWGTDYREFEQARCWWRPKITMDKLLFWQR
ncbi:MAG: hypothetical protein PUF45_08755 [Lachnospiraceae bacterium]|nr:hypothetical protein [Lachnospiraceae bacterium]